MNIDNDSVISAIYTAYIEDGIKGIKAISIYDLKETYTKLKKFERDYRLSSCDRSELEADIICEFASQFEKRGFTDGIKVAVQLLFEACGKGV